MKLLNELHRFYYDLSLHELKSMNANTVYANISHNSLLYLDLISYKENCTASYLAEILHISKPAVTIKLNDLIKQGFVVKKQSETDKRVYYISVSPSVEDEYKKYDNRLNSLAKKLLEKYDSAEIDKLCEMLKLVRAFYHESELDPLCK